MDRPLHHTISSSTSPELDPGSAFELCFELEYERVFAAVYFTTGSRRDAEDMAQMAFLRTWERWDRVCTMERPSLFPLRWAFRPLRSVLHRRRGSFLDRLHGEPTLEPFEDIRLDDDVRRLIVGLSRRERAASVMAYGLDLTPGEAGRVVRRRAVAMRVDVASAEASIRRWADEQPPNTLSNDGDVDPVVDVIETVRRAAEPTPGAFDRHLTARTRTGRRRRITTIALVAALAASVAFAAGRSGRPAPPLGTNGSGRTPSQVASERIRLPGLLMRASVTIPDGWVAGDSIWGADGPGVAALSTGPDGARVSVAVFDLILLSPFDPATDHMRALTANGRAGWFAAFRRSFDRDTRARLVPDGSMDPQRFPAWDPLAWVLARAPARGPIHVSQPRIDDRAGSLVSFVQKGGPTALFSVYREGTIALQPGVTYTFWAPASGEPLAGDILIGVARETGATTGQEWAVIDSLKLRSY